MELTILQSIILGIIQGITEWLPISSSGMITLVMSNFFEINNIELILKNALWLHLGTFLAALVYFFKPVKKIIAAPFSKSPSTKTEKKIFKFLLITTIISGMLGFILLETLLLSENILNITGKTITILVGVLLLITGVLQVKIRNQGVKSEANLKTSDGILLGISQGLAALPGISRSGITVATLMLRKFNDTSALKLSFLMSLPIVLIGNIFLNIKDFTLGVNAIYGLIASFVFGLLTIHVLIKISKRINLGYFILVFAVLMLLSVLI